MKSNHSSHTSNSLVQLQAESSKIASNTKSISSHATPILNSVLLSHKIIYSGISGAIATTCIYPIDITKTKLMNSKAKQYTGQI